MPRTPAVPAAPLTAKRLPNKSCGSAPPRLRTVHSPDLRPTMRRLKLALNTPTSVSGVLAAMTGGAVCLVAVGGERLAGLQATLPTRRCRCSAGCLPRHQPELEALTGRRTAVSVRSRALVLVFCASRASAARQATLKAATQ